ncbi:hypothetical protein I308_100997 [Cryptococcus tetragattii IND107]|uniref:Uncharacterized protein n=1 Tax=Cryptococcus tetragattii IND107 TaxID=1296105 RepID=A0ABR3BZ03_9TREE
MSCRAFPIFTSPSIRLPPSPLIIHSPLLSFSPGPSHILYRNQTELRLGNEFWADAYSRLLKPAVVQLPEEKFEDLEIVQERIQTDEQLLGNGSAP